MAEFCLKHFNELFNRNLTKKDVILELDLCEGCGEIKPCVVDIRLRRKIKDLIEEVLEEKK